MKKIAFINQKGGTGKTTTSANLGAALALLRKKVLLIDLDSQGNLGYSFGVDGSRGSVTDVLLGRRGLMQVLSERENLWIAPSDGRLADLELSLVGVAGREMLLRNQLARLDGFDLVFIDCSPSLSVLTINALTAADEVVIPLQMEILSLHGLAKILATIREVREVLNHGLKINGIIPCMFDRRRKLSQEVLDQVQAKLGGAVYSTVIRECVRIAEAPSFARSVIAYAPGSNGADDFRRLAREFIRRN